MYKFWVIAHREYVAIVGTKAFLFTLVMMPILMFGSFLVMPMLDHVGGGKTLRIFVADGTGELFDQIIAASQQRNEALEKQTTAPKSSGSGRGSFMESRDYWQFEAAPNEAGAGGELSEADRLALSDRVRSGELYAFVEIPAALVREDFDGSQFPSFVSPDAMINPTRMWLAEIINQHVKATRIRQLKLESIPAETWQRIESRVELKPNVPYMRTVSTNGESVASAPARDALTAMFLPFGVMMLMFMVILMAAQPMLESAMEEKGLRISEVLLGSVSAGQLMGGKLLGNVAASMLIFVLYGSGGYYFLTMQGLANQLPWSVLCWFIVFQILGVLFFSSIFLTVGASVNELKEAQTLLLPVWLLLMAPTMVWVIAIRDPNGIVATSLSFIPTSCSMMMVFRLASGTAVPFWQPPAAAIVMILATTGMVMLAGRIYRNGLLRSDGVRSLPQLIKRLMAS